MSIALRARGSVRRDTADVVSSVDAWRKRESSLPVPRRESSASARQDGTHGSYREERLQKALPSRCLSTERRRGASWHRRRLAAARRIPIAVAALRLNSSRGFPRSDTRAHRPRDCGTNKSDRRNLSRVIFEKFENSPFLKRITDWEHIYCNMRP